MKTDVRDAFEAADNPVVLGALKFRVTGSLEEMEEMLVGNEIETMGNGMVIMKCKDVV